MESHDAEFSGMPRKEDEAPSSVEGIIDSLNKISDQIRALMISASKLPTSAKKELTKRRSEIRISLGVIATCNDEIGAIALFGKTIDEKTAEEESRKSPRIMTLGEFLGMASSDHSPFKKCIDGDCPNCS